MNRIFCGTDPVLIDAYIASCIINRRISII